MNEIKFEKTNQHKGNWNSIPCPICNSKYNQILKCEHKLLNAWSGKGDAVRIPMQCEEDCKWTLIIGEHKGNIFLTYEAGNNE